MASESAGSDDPSEYAESDRNPVMQWLLLDASRETVTFGAVGGVFLLTAALVRAGVVSPTGNISTLLASGIASGLLTLITVTLSINQLILSRVFGHPGALSDELDSSIAFRERIEGIANVSTSPNEPSEFLVLILDTMRDRLDALEASGGDAVAAFDDELDDLREYVDGVQGSESDKDTTSAILSTLLDPAYAYHIRRVRDLKAHHSDDLPQEATDHLVAVLDLLKAVAVVRQFLKTLAIQQDLARLSRLVGYLGLAAFLTTVYLSTVYQRPGTTLPTAWMPYVVALAVPIIVAPLAAIIAYVLRIATVAMYTGSVGPFVPPEERA